MERPRLFVNMAMTADGKITSATREYPRLTSDYDRRNMDRLRARADALLVGAGTVRADDPPLHVRDEAMRQYRRTLGKPDALTRIVVSASARLDPASRFFDGRDGALRIVATTEDAPEARLRALGPDVELLRSGRQRVDLTRLVCELARRGIRDLLVEGGAELNGQLLEQDLIDELYVTIAPTLLGGRDAPTPFGGVGLSMSRRRRLALAELHREGDELYCRYVRAEDGD